MTDSDRMAHLKERLLATEIMAQMPDLINAHAVEFVAGLMKNWYTITNDGEFETTSETPLSTTDLRPMPVSEVSQYLHSEHSYLFRQSVPSGNSNASTKAAPPPTLNRAEMSIAEKADYIHRHGEQAYLSLPASPTEAKPLAEKRRSEMSIEERTQLIRERGSEFYMSLPA